MLCLIEFESVMTLHVLILSSYLSASSCGISLWAPGDVKLIWVTHQSADDISVFYLKKTTVEILSLEKCHGLFTLEFTGPEFYNMLVDLKLRKPIILLHIL